MATHKDPAITNIGMCKAKKTNPRAYVHAKCGDDKYRLIIEVTKKQSTDYEKVVSTMKMEAESRVSQGEWRLSELKAWARGRRAELLK